MKKLLTIITLILTMFALPQVKAAQISTVNGTAQNLSVSNNMQLINTNGIAYMINSLTVSNSTGVDSNSLNGIYKLDINPNDPTYGFLINASGYIASVYPVSTNGTYLGLNTTNVSLNPSSLITTASNIVCVVQGSGVSSINQKYYWTGTFQNSTPLSGYIPYEFTNSNGNAVYYQYYVGPGYVVQSPGGANAYLITNISTFAIGTTNFPTAGNSFGSEVESGALPLPSIQFYYNTSLTNLTGYIPYMINNFPNTNTYFNYAIWQMNITSNSYGIVTNYTYTASDGANPLNGSPTNGTLSVCPNGYYAPGIVGQNNISFDIFEQILPNGHYIINGIDYGTNAPSGIDCVPIPKRSINP